MLVNEASTTIEIPLSPAIDKVRLFPYRGKDDFQKLSNLINICRKNDGLEEYLSPESLEAQYSHLNNCDLYQDFMMAEVQDEPVAYTRVFWWEDRATGDRIYEIILLVDPNYRNTDLARILLVNAENRLKDIAASHNGSFSKVLGASAWDTQPEFHQIYQDAGYRAIRCHYSMERLDLENIPDAPLPQGLEVRPVQPDQYRQVWEASVESFRDHWGFSEPTEEDYQGWLVWPQFNPSIWQVAWDGDQVAGMVLNFIDEEENRRYGKKRGWTENICVRRQYRKRGLARHLIARSLIMMKEMGFDGARLGVDAENLSGALQLYQSMGYQVKRISTFYRKPLE